MTVGIYLYSRMNSEIRRQVEQTLAAQFPHLNVSVGGARLVEDRGIAIHKLVISETTANQLESNLLVVDELLIDCDVQLAELIQGKTVVRRVIVRHPQVWISREVDGRINLNSLWPLPQYGDSPPRIIVEDARITLIDRQHPSALPIALRDVNLTIQASVDSAPRSNAGNTPITQCEVHGTLGGPHFQEAEFRAICDLAEPSLQVKGNFTKLNLSPELLSWGEVFLGSKIKQFQLQGSLSGEFAASHTFREGSTPHVNARLALSQAQLSHPRIPRSLTDLSCEIRIDGSTTIVDGLRCNCGASGLALQMERRGWHPDAPLSLSARAENLMLDEPLFLALPEALQAEWAKYKPTGVVDADLQLTFDGRQWRPAATLTGHNLAFEAEKFPYRVTDGSGTIRYSPSSATQPALLDIDLVGMGGGQPLRFSGQVIDPQPGALGWIEVTGSNVEIDDRMIAALPEQVRRVISSLNAEGRFNVRWRIDRTLPGQLKPYSSLRLELVNCRINYERFPYPLTGIRGVIQAEDNRWSFRDLASGGSRNVECQGALVPTDTGSELTLRFVGKEVPMDDDLQRALPASVQRAWTELRPRGRVDLVAEIYHQTGLAKPSIRVAVTPRPDSASIEPRFFPYLMNLNEGAFNYQDGRMTIAGVSASHGRTTLRTQGSGEFRPDGSWHMQLEDLTADRLAAKRDLIGALPPKLQQIVDHLRPTGNHFWITNGTLRFAKAADPLPTITAQWDIELGCHQTDIQVGVDLQNIHGSVRLVGFSDGVRAESAGELALDTVTFQDVQFTDLRGPVWIDEGRCLVGQWACEKQGLPVRHLTARMYDGTVTSDTWITFDDLPRYRADAQISDVSLARLMIERFHGQRAFNGKVAATLSLEGTGRSLHALTGKGEVKVTEANIYELPLLVGLLKVLRNSSPDTTAFNEVDMAFRIQGRHVMLDKLNFLGDAVSLYGEGTTNFEQQLNLAFHGVIGQNNARLPMIKNLIDRTGEQFMQMYVDGTISNPKIHTQALPGINQLIQQIQTELDTSATNIRQADRTVFPVLGR